MNRDLESRIERLERETGVCLCDKPLVSFARTQEEADAPHTSAAGCPLHPGERRHIIVMKFNLDDEPTGVLPVADPAPTVANAIEPAPASQTVEVGSEDQPYAARAPVPAGGALAAALGPAEAEAFKAEVRLALADLAWRGVGIDPFEASDYRGAPISEWPLCADPQCRHPARTHSQMDPRRPCRAVMTVTGLGVDGPCRCTGYQPPRSF